MRTFSQGRVARGMAHALTVAFLWSAVLVGAVAVPAGAQIPTGAGPVVSARTVLSGAVAVVPFANVSGYQPETFGKQAADAIAAELSDRLFLDVVSEAEVEMGMRDLGYTAPLSDGEMLRLGVELDLALLVTGTVRMARIEQSEEGRYAQVELAVRLFDALAQATVNGALVKVRGPASTEASDDALMEKALDQAAFEAIREMKTRPTVTARVLWSSGDVVLFSSGSRAGVVNGMQLAAIRSGQRIGTVEVTEARPIDSYAKIIEGPPLVTGDYMRGIYELPTGVAAVSPGRIERKQKRWTTVALAAAALLGIADLGSTARTLVEGNVAAPGFTASNLANGVETGYALPGSPAVLCTWVPYNGTEKTRILGYEITRNDEFVAVLTVDDLIEQNFYIDHNVGLFVAEVEVTLETLENGLPYWEVTRSFDDYDPANPPTDLGLTVTDLDYLMRWVTFPPSSAAPFGPRIYSYRIKPIIIEQRRFSDGTYEWRFVVGTQWSSADRNYITPVAPPVAVDVDVSGTVATFFFYSPTGADAAVIQVAKDPYSDFPPDMTVQTEVAGIWSTADWVDIESGQVDLNDLAGLPGDPTILWWRVGARNRRDTTAARPWPLEQANDYGWVWSARQQLLVYSGASRAAMLHQERGALNRATVGRTRSPRRPGGVTGDRQLRTE